MCATAMLLNTCLWLSVGVEACSKFLAQVMNHSFGSQSYLDKPS